MILNSMKNNLEKTILEMFGEPIGKVPGITTVGAVGVRDMHEDNLGDICPSCGMMSIDGKCGCPEVEQEKVCEGCGLPASQCQCGMKSVCPMCGMMPVQLDAPCSCGLNEVEEGSACGECGMYESECKCGMSEAKKKGPSKETAKKILKGTKTFAQKMKKVSSWAEDPAAAAAWMAHKATGKWPSEK